MSVADYRVHTATVSRIIVRTSKAIASLRQQYIKFPAELYRTQQDFFEIASFPTVISAIDCSHIQSPGMSQANRIHYLIDRFVK